MTNNKRVVYPKSEDRRKDKEEKSLKEKNMEKSQQEHPDIANIPGPQLSENLIKWTIEIVDGKPVIRKSE
jgi:hypothetical protein